MTTPKPPKGPPIDDVIPTPAPQVSASKAAPDSPTDDPPSETVLERIGWKLARVQLWGSGALMVGGFLMWLVLDWVRLGLGLMGGALVLSGLVPMLTARYRSSLWILRGWKARLRGLVSVAIGLFVIIGVLTGP